VARLGSTVAEIARTKAGIIKPDAIVVTAEQSGDALSELSSAAERNNASMSVQQRQFSLVSSAVAVGGQLITVKGRAATYPDLFLPLFGHHQAQNAAVAIAAVESFLGDGSQAIAQDVVVEGLATVTSPGRLQVIGIEPSVIVDAAHNPDGAQAVARAMGEYFTFEEIAIVLGVLEDKDTEHIIQALAPLTSRFHVTASTSDRAIAPDDLAYLVRDIAGADATYEFDTLEEAVDEARRWAGETTTRAVLVTGSITLVGETMALAARQGWMR
jgi:dihydrofolate synthase/folylpolyglutamate synthase